MLKKIESLLPKALIKDRHKIGREITRFKRLTAKSAPNEKTNQRLVQLEKQLQKSIEKRLWRKRHRPDPIYNDTLPILSKKDEIIDSILNNPVVIISGETGSGKTTQIPKFCLAAGCGIDGEIGCTQPRRIAAVTVSRRIADELGEKLGEAVGYKIRFKDKTGPHTFIKIMTDGILLAEAQNDPNLNEYDSIIVDEAHERSLNIDFILGLLKTLLKRRKNLKLIITSATIDTEKFSKAFDNAPIIEVSGRMYPVNVQYVPVASKFEEKDAPSHVEAAISSIDPLVKRKKSGDILVFMPTEQDIRDTCELIKGKKYKNVAVFPLFARLAASEQSRVFSCSSGRKIIVATNIAETSLTIPGIKYVIDSGLARISRYTPRSRTTALPVSAISKSSADQRKGRCGRVENGICIRLYSEKDYQNRPLYTSPEILRANLADVILRMISLKLGDPSDFPFIDKPASKSIQDGFDLLYELGAIIPDSHSKKGKRKKRFLLTKKGKLMSKMPVDPRLSRMLIEAQDEGCLEEMMVIASVLSIQDPRERPAERTQEADQVQKVFADPSSDFVTLFNIWKNYHRIWRQEKTTAALKRFCKTHFLSFKRMREWRDIHAQLSEVLREYGLKYKKNTLPPAIKTDYLDKTSKFSPLYTAIHKSILSGFLSNIAVKKEKNLFQGTKEKEVMIFPGSTLFNKAETWIVAAELFETSRLFARTCANIDSEWLEKLGKDLCKYTYLHPHWERKRGEVVAHEQVSLFGLIIISGRPVSYGRINPDHATEIFLQRALVEGDIRNKFPFMLHNQHIIDGVKDMENRIRRRDILVSEADLLEFYKKRLDKCYDIKTLTRYLQQNKVLDHRLRMKTQDIIRYDPDYKELSLFPDRIKLGNRGFACTYNFSPGETDDGITIKIPSALADQVSPDPVEWLVPGLYREKITALVRSLPKHFRKRLVPVADTVDIIVKEMPRGASALITSLSEFINTRLGIDIPASAWSEDLLPDHLKMRISITDSKGEELCCSRDLSILKRPVPYETEPDEPGEIKSARNCWERNGITSWDFPDLPECIHLNDQNRTRWFLYPGLQKADGKDNSVNLRLFKNSKAAVNFHKEGIAVLFAVYFSKELRFLKKALKLPDNMKKKADFLGGAAHVEKRMYNSMIHQLFYKNIRSKDDFYTHAECMAPVILSKGRELRDKSLAVLEAYHETRTLFYHLETIHSDNTAILELLNNLRSSLSRLVPKTFMDLYDMGRLVHLVRYIKAMAIRAQRAMTDFEKDRAKAEKVRIFTDSLNRFLKELSPAATEDKKAAIEEYFWLIEEYKVSVFAQEIKTPVPISKKRLQEKIKAIERMA